MNHVWLPNVFDDSKRFLNRIFCLKVENINLVTSLMVNGCDVESLKVSRVDMILLILNSSFTLELTLNYFNSVFHR